MKTIAALLFLVAGCKQADLCSGHDGTCIGLTVEGSVGPLDELSIMADQKTGSTKKANDASFELPITTVLYLSQGGSIQVDVVGSVKGNPVATGSAPISITTGEHASLAVTLQELASDGGVDFSTPIDAATDGPAGPRYIFLLATGIDGNFLANGGSADALCASDAAQNNLAGTFHALIGLSSADPTRFVPPMGTRSIILPGGAGTVATENTLFSTQHNLPIDARRERNANRCR